MAWDGVDRMEWDGVGLRNACRVSLRACSRRCRTIFAPRRSLKEPRCFVIFSSASTAVCLAKQPQDRDMTGCSLPLYLSYVCVKLSCVAMKGVPFARGVRGRSPGCGRISGRGGADAGQRIPRPGERPGDHHGAQQDRPTRRRSGPHRRGGARRALNFVRSFGVSCLCVSYQPSKFCVFPFPCVLTCELLWRINASVYNQSRECCFSAQRLACHPSPATKRVYFRGYNVEEAYMQSCGNHSTAYGIEVNMDSRVVCTGPYCRPGVDKLRMCECRFCNKLRSSLFGWSTCRG